MQVMGANIVKSGSRTFAVYSISVTDVNSNHSWSIKRRLVLKILRVYFLISSFIIFNLLHALVFLLLAGLAILRSCIGV